MIEIRRKIRKVKLLPTRDYEAGYGSTQCLIYNIRKDSLPIDIVKETF